MTSKLKAFFFLFVLFISTQTSAAYYCPPKGGLYISGFGAANWSHLKGWYNNVDVDCKAKYCGGVALGYTSYTSPFRIEAEFAHRTNTLEHIKQCGIERACYVHTHTWSYMANALYELDSYPFKPYAGFGVGYVHSHTPKLLAMVFDNNEILDESSLTLPENNNVAWQAIVGVSYPLLTCLDLGLEYRFFQVSVDDQNHSFGLALRTSF